MGFWKFLSVVLVASGAGTIVGGVCGFAFAYRQRSGEQITAEGWGQLDGHWNWYDVCFLACVLIPIGTALLVLGLWLALTPPRPGVSCRRTLAWVAALVVAFGTLGGLLVAFSLTAGEPQTERDIALDVGIAYLDALDNGRAKAESRTEDYARRLDAAPERVAYHFSRYGLRDRSVRRNEVRVEGYVRATGKTTRVTGEHGAISTKETFPERRRVGVYVRLVRGEAGRWLIDDVVFTEP